jgi:hypothetical protein
MKKLVLGSISIALAIGFTGCTKVAELKENGFKPLSTSAIKSAIIGKTLSGDHHRGWTMTLTNNEDGTFVIKNSKGNTVNGKWRMNGNKYCNQSNGKEMRKGKEACFPVYNENGIYHFMASNGSPAFSLK